MEHYLNLASRGREAKAVPASNEAGAIRNYLRAPAVTRHAVAKAKEEHPRLNAQFSTSQLDVGCCALKVARFHPK
jgi:hypothetical protein